ncbi:hypothetical protein LTR10_021896 [Elasticomyces elasticus]|uniref:Wax synthase domain-containing protein n=1 Tax=Exophiala sideris TaxID=1016849 RepID=A0ABR0JQG8_9EURO|nr:hypothetical protein LTR10_021896 [Elasticomyces elasticus]KAK5039793.1 hypothetical protein LTS07_000288 [Exophiala sideris]KAK5041345.1 hypothetical protein LTR13_002820 [Exophiala sideris]KAK5068172.1 hypothetical protein LTR69_000290 [Exophiala sideris]KAK5187473.1 hypothetical protein LTR44_000289 [Eurotiomycetes sp. CCFEE 6388]
MTERPPMTGFPTIHYVPQLQHEMNRTAFSRDNSTAERQPLYKLVQVLDWHAPFDSEEVRVFARAQYFLLIAPLCTAFLYIALFNPDTPLQQRNRCAVFIALVGGFCANAVDHVSQRGFGEPFSPPTLHKWSKETARILANYSFAIMYMAASAWLYEGSRGHGEQLSGANGTAWMNSTVWRNGTLGVQAPRGFNST